MFKELIQMLKDEIRMRKEDIIRWFGKEEKKDPNKLTEAERWVESELACYRCAKLPLTHNSFGIHYSERYLRTHTAEEAYAQYLADSDELIQFIDDCVEQNRKKERAARIAERMRNNSRKVVMFEKRSR